MKKILLFIVLISLSLIGNSQIDTTGMTDYEKYYHIKNGDIDTSQIQSVKKIEYDDLYVTSKDNYTVSSILKRNNREKINNSSEKQLYSKGYNDGLLDAYDYYFDDDMYYSNTIYRFRYPFRLHIYYGNIWNYSYYYLYDPFYWDYFFWDHWYYNSYFSHFYNPYYWYRINNYNFWNYYPRYIYNYNNMYSWNSYNNSRISIYNNAFNNSLNSRRNTSSSTYQVIPQRRTSNSNMSRTTLP
jgi:hypothetical protein